MRYILNNLFVLSLFCLSASALTFTRVTGKTQPAVCSYGIYINREEEEEMELPREIKKLKVWWHNGKLKMKHTLNRLYN